MLRLFRLPNLVLLAIMQAAVRVCVAVPAVGLRAWEAYYSETNFWLGVMMTAAAAASGYVVNDLYDLDTDQINKPSRVVVGKLLSVRHTWAVYAALWVVVVACSAALAMSHTILGWYGLLPTALLWLYAAYLKRTPFVGNLLVASLTAWAVAFPLFPLLEAPPTVWANLAGKLGLAYIAFAFVANLWREVVKDLEDVEGDAMAGCQTLPVVWGMRKTQYLALALGAGFVVLTAALLFVLYNAGAVLAFVVGVSLLLCPSLFALYLLKEAEEPTEYNLVSSIIKGIIAVGLLLLPLSLLHMG